MGPRLRLALLALLLCAVPIAFALSDLSVQPVRDAVDGAGAWGPFLYVVASAALGALLLPGPLLAGLSGVLFGPVVGTLATVTSAVLSSLVSREIGRRAGYSGAVEVLGPRAPAVARVVEHEGFGVVLVQRLAPGIPDAPLSYAFGALGVSRRDLALGTALGTLPRAFSYTAIGASVDDPTGPLAVSAWVGVVLSAVLGAWVARRAWIDLRTPVSSP